MLVDLLLSEEVFNFLSFEFRNPPDIVFEGIWFTLLFAYSDLFAVDLDVLLWSILLNVERVFKLASLFGLALL